jgi:hypothetical protein
MRRITQAICKLATLASSQVLRAGCRSRYACRHLEVHVSVSPNSAALPSASAKKPSPRPWRSGLLNEGDEMCAPDWRRIEPRSVIHSLVQATRSLWRCRVLNKRRRRNRQFGRTVGQVAETASKSLGSLNGFSLQTRYPSSLAFDSPSEIVYPEYPSCARGRCPSIVRRSGAKSGPKLLEKEKFALQ